MKSLKLGWLIILEYVKRNRELTVAGIVILLSLIFLLAKLNIFYSAPTLRIGLIGTYQEHDLPLAVTKLISKGLVEATQAGRLKPNLVAGWEVNNDATQFKFKLKDNLRWNDNSKIKSSDLDFPIPNTTLSYPDDKTIQFNLKESYSPLPSLLAAPVFKKGTLIGTGEYKIATCSILKVLFPHPCIDKSRIFISKITLEPVSSVGDKPKIVIRFYPNEKVAATGFSLGEVQAILGVSNPHLLPAGPSIALRQGTDFSKIVTILFQTKDALLSNRSLRQALAFSAPQIQNQETANNPYPPALWAYNSDAKKYLNNPEEAKAAIDRAKSQVPDDKLKGELVLTATANLEDTGKSITEAWKKLGFDSKLRIESGIPQNFQALLITQSIPIDPDQYALWHATQTKTNLTKYDSKRTDKDLEDGRKLITEDDRKAKYFDFQKTLLEDAPAAFLYFPKYNIIYLKKTESLLNKVFPL